MGSSKRNLSISLLCRGRGDEFDGLRQHALPSFKTVALITVTTNFITYDKFLMDNPA